MNWDEARHGANAYEMLQRNNFIVNTYNYRPDYWNLKPPLSYWLIMLGYRLFGYNALGLRFYSAFFFVLTVILTALYVRKRHGNAAGIFALLLFCAITPFYAFHNARAGDADSLFVFLFTASILAFLLSDRAPWLLAASGLCAGLAFLDKSWHAGAILLILLSASLIKKQSLQNRLRSFALWAAPCVLPVIGWAVWRYSQDGPTFFEKMLDVDLLGRSSGAMEHHWGDILFYVNFLFSSKAVLAAIGIIAGGIILCVLSKEKLSFDEKVVMLWAALPLILYSVEKTKLVWYIFPTLIPIVIGACAGLAVIIRQRPNKGWLAVALLLPMLLIGGDIIGNAQAVSLTQNRSPVQRLILQSLNRHSPYAGRRIYFQERGGLKNWSQGNLLQAELSANAHCENGGAAAFVKDRGSLLIIAGKADTAGLRKSFKTLCTSGGYELLINDRISNSEGRLQ